MTVVVGTAGHIDHGKTALLRALTGIDADRLPEERRRGMTIDVGYAHMTLPDGDALDFVDVPGHDRLVGNMLVGAGEVDAALLVVAVDDGPRAQTLEHLELLDALGIEDGIAVITKVDVLAADDARRVQVADAVAGLLARTTLAGAPIVLASAVSGEGLDAVHLALIALRDRARARMTGGRPGSPGRDDGGPDVRLAVDRSFSIRGRGTVVTGTLRGGPLERDAALRLLPAGRSVRAREVQVHGEPVARITEGGRVALNLAGIDARDVRRGDVLAGGRAAGRVVATDRALVALRPPAALAAAITAAPLPAALRDGTPVRIHVATAHAEATVRRARHDVAGADGSLATTLRFAEPLAVAPGDRFVLRAPSSGATLAGGVVLDPLPPVGASRRAATPAAVTDLRAAILAGDPVAEDVARVALHGAVRLERLAGGAGAFVPAAAVDPGVRVVGPLAISPALADALEREVLASIVGAHDRNPDAPGLSLGDARTVALRGLRRRATVRPADAALGAAAIVDGLVRSGRLARDGEALRDPARPAGPPMALAAAMDRLVAALSSATPPSFDEAVRTSGCPPEGVRLLEQAGRIVRLSPELAFAADAYRDLAARALELARSAPLTPAAFRDATGSSRKYALAILEDLDRRQILRRGPDGHVPGTRAPRPAAVP